MRKKKHIMKELIGKTKTKTRNLPQRTTIGEKEIFDKKTIVKKINYHFINIGPNVQSYKSISYENLRDQF